MLANVDTFSPVVKKINNENQRTKQLFIPYKGMLKILFSSRTGNVDKFVDGVTETLYTVQLGTECDKETLAASIMGIVKTLAFRLNPCDKFSKHQLLMCHVCMSLHLAEHKTCARK